jgi:chemotaxis family two-component system sensor kinase Cph1
MGKSMNIDLNNCDKERIHQISYIQGHGAFVAVSAHDLRIKSVSLNFPTFFQSDTPGESLIGLKLNEILSLELHSLIIDKLRNDILKGEVHHTFVYRGQRPLDVFMYRISAEVYGIEFERHPEGHSSEEKIREKSLNHFLSELQKAKTVAELAKLTCTAVRRLTAFDRVMVYRFFPPTMYGEVIGEDKVAHAPTFLHHRFPASDIPKPARDLYLKNQIRFIYDQAGENVEIFPKLQQDNTPFDLSDSRLRGVSLIHLDYLKNMGVVGAFSIAIIIEDKLWGLISCHSHKVRYIDHETRALCDILSQTFALCAPVMGQLNLQSEELDFHQKLQAFFAEIKLSEHPLDKILRMGDKIRSLFHCEGVAIVKNGKVDMMGLTPLSSEVKELGNFLSEKMAHENQSIYWTDALSKAEPRFANIKDQVSGVMALSISEADKSLLMFFRPEMIHTIQWGGDPRKSAGSREYQGSINPRASFKTWTEVIKENSRGWEDYEIAGGKFFKNFIFDSLIRREELISELRSKSDS